MSLTRTASSPSRCNTAQVALDKVVPAAEQEKNVDMAIWHKGQTDDALLRKLLEDHHRWTGSLRARDILDNWSEARGKFVKVFPHEYKRALGEINATKTAQDTIAKAKGEPTGDGGDSGKGAKKGSRTPAAK